MSKEILAHWARIVRQNVSDYEREVLNSSAITSAEGVHRLLRERALSEDIEHFYVVCFDASQHVKAISEVARGGSHMVATDMKEIFRVAIAYGCSGIALCHNHPNGDPTPSNMDIDLTLRVLDVAKMLDIIVLDHVVIGSWDKFTSIKDYTRMMATGLPDDMIRLLLPEILRR